MKSDKFQVKKGTEDLATKVKQGTVTQNSGKNLTKATNHLIQGGVVPKDLLGMSDQMVDGIYGQAYRLYQTGVYKEACQLFRLLIIIKNNEPKYSLGLAASLHMLKDYKKAAEMYSISGLLDPQNPIPHFHASDCYIQMRDPLSAIIALEIAVKKAGNKPEFKVLKDRALLTISSLQKEVNKR